MKNVKNFLFLALLGFLSSTVSSCKVHYGCPANGRNVGAERILSGEKLPKAPKFKA